MLHISLTIFRNVSKVIGAKNVKRNKIASNHDLNQGHDSRDWPTFFTLLFIINADNNIPKL